MTSLSSSFLVSNSAPAVQYQTQKQIQKTVRVPASLYTFALKSLAGFERPLSTGQWVQQAGSFYYIPPTVRWNQMSDRAVPSISKVKTASGGTYHTSSVRHSITRARPGAMHAGGEGCDIKHNCYDRYLNRIKGQAPLRRGVIPPHYGAPVPSTRAFPIQGGKVVKTAIVNGCAPLCPSHPEETLGATPVCGVQPVRNPFVEGETVWIPSKRNVAVYATTENATTAVVYTVVRGTTRIQRFPLSQLQKYKPDCVDNNPFLQLLEYQQGNLTNYDPQLVTDLLNV